MSKGIATYALMKGGRIYTLTAARDHKPFRYIAWCDGSRCGAFRSKKDFEAFVDMEPGFPPRGPHADACDRAEMVSTLIGSLDLQRIVDVAKKNNPQRFS